MEAWIGLAGVIAGAAIALGGQYLTRRSEQRERLTTVLLEQCATVVALSEDFRNRVWEERNQLAENVVAMWDLAAYRLAEARLRILCRDPDVLAAVEVLRKSGASLGETWRLSPKDEAAVNAALEAHRSALKAFIAVGSGVLGAKFK
jgi:hypothetical protein